VSHAAKAVLALVLAGLLASPGAALAGQPPRVGVIVAVEVNLAPGEGHRLGALVGSVLAEQLEIHPVAGSAAARRLPGGVAPTCLSAPGCLRRVAHRLAVDQLLVLVAVRIGDTLQVDASWVDPQSGEVRARPRIQLAAALDGSARAALAAAARRLLPRAVPRRTPLEVADRPAERPRSERSGRVDRHMTRGAWMAAGVAGAALIGGISFTAAAAGQKSELDNQGCGEVQACPTGADQLERRARAADLLFVTAAVASGVAGYLYFQSGSTTLAVEPRGDGVGLSLGGRF
jgi:hypothetical protein